MTVRRIAGLAGIATLLSAAGLVVAPAALAVTRTLSIASLSVTETNASQVRTVAVRLSAASGATVKVRVASSNGTALAGKDYTAVPLTTLTFAPGQVVRYVAVTVLGDTLDEANETFKLLLSAPTGATIYHGRGVITIADDDAPPVVRVVNQSLAEGSSGFRYRSVAISLSTASGRNVSVGWATAGGTAVSGDDFEPSSGRVTIPAGALSANAVVSVDGDTIDEPDERFYVGLSSPVNATISTVYGRVVLLDDDAPRTPIINPLPKTSGQSDVVMISGVAQTGTTVRVYRTGNCSGALAITSSADQLNGGGLGVQVPINSTTLLTVDVLNVRDEHSACSNAVSYTEDEIAPPAPVASGFQPTSPANNNSPRVTGTTQGASTVIVYQDACGGPVLAMGTPAAFAGTGIPFPVAENQVVSVLVAARDAAGNVSACTGFGTYTEDSIPPPPPTVTAFVPSNDANNNFPRVQGVAQGTLVLVYEGSCKSPTVFQGTASSYASPGVGFGVADNTTTAVFVSTRDAAGNESTCASAGTYTEDSTAPGPVTDLAFAGGPTAVGTQPTLTGTSDTGGVQVWTADCVTLLATLTQAQLGAGTRLPVPPVATTQFHVDNIDGAGNHLGCPASQLVSYREISTENEASNETPATATALPNTPGLDSMLGELGSPTDQDWFTVTLPVTSNLRIQTLGVPGGPTCQGLNLDTVLTLYDSSGTNVLTSNDDAGDGFCSLITRTAQAAGTYYVEVTAAPFAGVLPYPVSYRLDVSSGQLSPASFDSSGVITTANEAEANNTVGTAQALGSLTTATDVLGHLAGSTGDVDYYSFTLAAPQTVSATIQDGATALCEDSLLDTKVTFLDSAGVVPPVSDEDSGPGLCSRLSMTLPAGTYLVKVEGSPSAQPGTVDGDYVLALR
jgi:hypothetical protein